MPSLVAHAANEGAFRVVQLPTSGDRSSFSRVDAISSTPTALLAPLALPGTLADSDRRSELLGAMIALLHRYAQQSKIAIDVLDGAPGPDLPPTGRVVLDVEVTPESAVSHVVDEARRALAAPRLPLVAGPGRSNIAIVLESAVGAGAPGEGSVRTLDGYDVHFVFRATAAGASLSVTYNAEILGSTTVQRLVESYVVLLEASLRDPATPVERLPLLGPREVRALTVDRDGGTAAYPRSPVVRAFERLAAAQPGATAATFHGESLTYAELDAQSSRLARYLVEHGVGPELPVAVCVAPSLDVLVAMLGIWKARGLYLPIDPTHPESLVGRMLDEARPRLVLTTSALAPLTARFPQLRLDADAELVRARPAAPPDVEPALADPACLFYTSGTTGRPKGVVLTQANVAQYVHSAADTYGFRQGDVFVSLARYTFSISLFELVSPLLCGGSVTILGRDEILTPHLLHRALEGVTVLHAGPSLLGSLFRYLRSIESVASSFPRMRHASSGGDIVSPAIMEEMKSVFPNAELFVIYGCTEIACMGTTFPIPRETKVDRTFVGKPFPNVAVKVVDAAQNLVPFGVVGEIWFAGDGVSRGYLQRPELTAEKFVEADGARFYRSGDMGRLHPSGDLEILGRRDFQVQLRGIRIELAGIERIVQELGLAAQCAVVARRVGDGDRLVAFVVKPSAPSTPDDHPVASFRRALAKELPDYMLPNHLVVLDALPLTANGKIDRNRLKEMPWEPAAGTQHDGADPPANDRERTIAQVFARVLGLAEIGVDDDFFDSGGDSLLAVVALEEIERATGAVIPSHVLFENGTVRALARFAPDDAPSESRPIRLGPASPAVPLFMLSGVHLYRELARRLEGRCTPYGVFTRREVDALAPLSVRHGVEELARDYVTLVRGEQPAGPYRLLGYSFAGLVAYEVAHQLRAAGEEVSLLVLVDSYLPEWTGGWRFRLAQMRRLFSAPSRDVAAFFARRMRGPYDPLDEEIKHAGDPRVAPLDVRRVATNREAAEHYLRRLRPYEGEVTLIVSGERLRNDPLKSPDCGWGPFVASLDVHTIDAGHFRMMSHEPFVSQMAAVVAARLERCADAPASRTPRRAEAAGRLGDARSCARP